MDYLAGNVQLVIAIFGYKICHSGGNIFIAWLVAGLFKVYKASNSCLFILKCS